MTFDLIGPIDEKMVSTLCKKGVLNAAGCLICEGLHILKTLHK